MGYALALLPFFFFAAPHAKLLGASSLQLQRKLQGCFICSTRPNRWGRVQLRSSSTEYSLEGYDYKATFDGAVVAVEAGSSTENAVSFSDLLQGPEAIDPSFSRTPVSALEKLRGSSIDDAGEEGLVPSDSSSLFKRVVLKSTSADFQEENGGLRACANLCKTGGLIALTKSAFPPQLHPSEGDLRQLIRGLPLNIVEYIDPKVNGEGESKMWDGEKEGEGGDGDSISAKGDILAVLKRTPYRNLEKVMYMCGPVFAGYGRGGKDLGVPTANLPESFFGHELRGVRNGVYYGFAAVIDTKPKTKTPTNTDTKKESDSDSEGDGGGVDDFEGVRLAEGHEIPKVYKAVVNIGYSPTFKGEENEEKVVEAHLMHYRGPDFYKKPMKLCLLGHIRGERKFPSLKELKARISKDMEIANSALENKWNRRYGIANAADESKGATEYGLTGGGHDFYSDYTVTDRGVHSLSGFWDEVSTINDAAYKKWHYTESDNK